MQRSQGHKGEEAIMGTFSEVEIFALKTCITV